MTTVTYAMDMDAAEPDILDPLTQRHGVRYQLTATHESGIGEYHFEGSLADLLGVLQDDEGWAGMDVLEQLDCIYPVCPKCDAKCNFVAHYGAPGVGSHWVCEQGHDWSLVGASFHDPAEEAHILDPADCV